MSVKLPIFMDNHSTTPVDPRVLETMIPFFTTQFGNAASRNHVFGWTAEAAVENARNQVAALIGGEGKEIVWTSGATESNNLAIKGAASFNKKLGNHVITVETEHKSVIDTCKRLQREGYDVTFLRPQKDGIVTPQMVTDAMTDKTVAQLLPKDRSALPVLEADAPVLEVAARMAAERSPLVAVVDGPGRTAPIIGAITLPAVLAALLPEDVRES